jgi:hypothetical protein
MAGFDQMLLEQQKALEEKQRRQPLPERGAGGQGASGEGEGAEGTGAGGAGGQKDGRTSAERRADEAAKAKGAGGKGGSKEGEGKGQPGEGTSDVDKERDANTRTAKAGEGQGEEPGNSPVSDTATGGSTAVGRGDGGAPVTAPVEGGPAPESHAPVPRDVGDGKDDDVVARQLREAAMREKDPVIRERLWQEYREYKKGKEAQ